MSKKIIILFCFLILSVFALLHFQWSVLGQNDTPRYSDSSNGKQCEKKASFNKIKERLKIVGNLLESPDPELVADAKQERLEIIEDLKKWAKKYKLELLQVSESEPIKIKNGKIAPFKQCSPVIEKDKLICLSYFNYFDHSSNTCVYQCLIKEKTK